MHESTHLTVHKGADAARR